VLIVDLTASPYMDSAGLGSLHEWLRQRGEGRPPLPAGWGKPSRHRAA
jgi:hypothetical protein